MRVLENAIHEKEKREELKARRNLLFKQFLNHPAETRLALDIRAIDDQLAESMEQTAQK